MKKLVYILFPVLLLSVVFAGCSKENAISAYDVSVADYSLSIDATKSVHKISDMLYGIFFEDINFAADGGLYAEMVVNRSFEFTALAKGDELYGWNAVGDAVAEVNGEDCLNENNTNYLVLTNEADTLVGIENKGFLEGMSLKKKAVYDFSFYAKALDGYSSPVTVRLTAGGKTVAEGKVSSLADSWKKYSLTLKSKVTASENVRLQVLIEKGKAAFDMISLFPQETYKNEKNGLRKDIAVLLEELQPKFLRFPGGCVIEGYDSATAYSWKDSVGVGRDGQPLLFNGTYGDVAARKQGINLWTDIYATEDEYPSFMTYGLGFFEFFRLSEDIGAVGVPVLNCGLYCQGRGRGPVDMDSDEFRGYIQDMFDLVEFCRGDENSVWGKVRVSLGHPEPFTLKYICIGNENEGQGYFERYSAFLTAFTDAKRDNPNLYDGLELIYSSGMDDGTSGANYLAAYEYAKEQLGASATAESFAGAVDAHYYNAPEWFLKNTDYYDEDNYKRQVSEMTDTLYGGAIPVFVGEYASWSNTLYSALAEAAYMTGLERNGDIVRMSTYAPLLSSVTARHWAPDLIWFNASSSMPSVNYEVQKLFSRNAGTTLLSSTLEGAYIGDKPLSGKVGVGTWLTDAEFDNLSVTKANGEIINYDFSAGDADFKSKWQTFGSGIFKVENGVLKNNSTSTDVGTVGSVAYFGNTDWNNYSFTVEAKKVSGDEGFFIPFAAKDPDNVYIWNIGGYSNTKSCLHVNNGGAKSGQVEGTVRDFVVETGRTYELKVVVEGTEIRCYIDGELYVDYDCYSKAEAEAYQVVSTDESGDIIIKLVNMTGQSKTFAMDIKSDGKLKRTAVGYQVAGKGYKDENIFGQKLSVDMKEFKLRGITDEFNYSLPAYSATVIRISVDKG